MPELTLELLSQEKSEKFTKPEIHLGRDPSCDAVFPSEKFPMVGRQHAVLRSSGGAWSVEDLQSTNGTFVNQVRIQRQQLVPGDTVRLGSDGPEIRIQFVDESYSATIRPAGLAAGPGVTVTSRVVPSPSDRPPTRPAEFAAPAGPQIAPTKPSEPPPTRPAVAPTAIAATRPSPLRYSAPAPAIDTPDAQMEHPDLIPGILPPEKQDEISEEEEEDPMNEQKLSLLRNLVILMVGLVLVLGGIVISQMQQLADIRQSWINV
jgi:predicted component of type VI protein secretion system